MWAFARVRICVSLCVCRPCACKGCFGLPAVRVHGLRRWDDPAFTARAEPGAGLPRGRGDHPRARCVIAQV